MKEIEEIESTEDTESKEGTESSTGAEDTEKTAKRKGFFGGIRNALEKINVYPIRIIIVIAIILDFINELLSRSSLSSTWHYITHYPGMFALNCLLVFSTLSITLIFRKRLSGVCLVSFLWLGLGICNYVVLQYRVTPFSAVDLKLLKSTASIFSQYLTKVQIVLIIVALALLLIGAIVMWIRIPGIKGHYRWWMYLLITIASFGAAYEINSIGIDKGWIPSDLGNISFVYDACGYNYCFVNSLYNVGIDKPDDYTEAAVDEVKSELGGTRSGMVSTRPNIIIVQLESFYNVNNMNDITCSENPLPNMTRLSKEYSTGYVTVPSIGAGTANTEFETISGMSLDYFGFCEYPYKTVLKKNTCESICYDLKQMNYTCTAIHNNRGNFYSRNKVFKNLGFDRFDSVEYMNDLEYNELGWVDDSVLTDEIVKAINSTDTPDFVYTITVASHGAYPTDEILTDPEITVSGDGVTDEARKNQFTYYVNAIHDTDEFVGELTDALSECDERCVVFFFGDHLPTLDIENEELENQTKFQTMYVMWDNFGMEKEDCNINSFQTTSYIMDRLGYNNGTLTKFHQNCSENADYDEELNLLEYDMLYGERYIYNETNPYDSTDLQMGIEPVTLTKAFVRNGNLYVMGENFTDSSYVYINGEKQETEREKNNYLVVKDVEIEDGDSVTVRQLAAGKTKLSKTSSYVYWSDPEVQREYDLEQKQLNGSTESSETGK